MIKVYQFDANMAIIKWDGLEDANLLAKIIQRDGDNGNMIQVKTINKELKE